MATESIVQDVSYAIRSLRRVPLFTLSVAGTIGLGLGILCSAFTVVNAYLFKPIDLREPHELFQLSWATETSAARGFTLDEVSALAASPSPLRAVAAATSVAAMYNARPLAGQLVTGNYFDVIGATVVLGRPLLPEDAVAPGARAVVVLSHEAWRTHFASDPNILGREITLDGWPFTVVGVTKPGQLLPGDDIVGFFAPLTMASVFPVADPWQEGVLPSLSVVGRVRTGGTHGELYAWFASWLRQRFPAGTESAARRVRVTSLATRIPQNRTTVTLFSMLVSVFGVVLLVACANVMNMMLARGLSRQRELGVRLSLGATRARVVRQLVIESLVLAIPAAAVGLALTLVTARVFPLLLLSALPDGTHMSSLFIAPLDPDARVLALLAISAVAGAILVGLSPALQVAGANLVLATRGELGSETRISRVRTALVGAQIAAAVLCLIGSTGLAREATRIATDDTGLDFDRVIEVAVPSDRRASIARHLELQPAIERVAVTSRAPFSDPPRMVRFVASRSGAPVEESAGFLFVSPGYFPLIGISLTRGRLFTENEATAGSPVVVISRATAERFWPGADPIGQTLEMQPVVALPERQRPQGRVTVIGVVEDVVQSTLFHGVPPAFLYFPVPLDTARPVFLLARGRADLTATNETIHAAIEDAYPNVAFETRPVRNLVALQVWAVGSFSTVAALPALVGLLLAFTGTYGVVAFLAAQRRKEFGVRMALGATTARIVRGMVGDAMRTSVIGAGAGALLAFLLGRALSSLFDFIPAFAFGPYVTAGVVVLCASVIAAWLPSARAARMDPSAALRAE